MPLQSTLDEIVAALQPELGLAGFPASYIPALAHVPAAQLGIAVCTRDGQEAHAGDGLTPFSIQSISKLFTLTLAMRERGESLWDRIGRSASGTAFNSLVQLEAEQGVPRNPFINAGALAVIDRLVSRFDAKAEVLALLSSLSRSGIEIDGEVAASEADTGFRNAALANFMKSFGKIDNDVDSVLDTYFQLCSIRMNCVQLARATGFLCRNGRHPCTDEEIVDRQQARQINSLMLTCGTYDAAGDCAYRVGLPCKSGVGGGIVAVVPGRLTLCVWSPALDPQGNSLLGLKALELFAGKTGLSIF